MSIFISAVVGLMITASHNEEPDNGVKLVDPAGEMLEVSWEKIATEVANAPDSELIEILKRIVQENAINETSGGKVIVGRDTRQSGEALAAAAIEGVRAACSIANDYGVITTPQLHYLVACTNNSPDLCATVESYYDKLSTAFKRIRVSGKNTDKYVADIVLDAANGVGAIAAKEFQRRLTNYLSIEIFNEGKGALNHKVIAISLTFSFPGENIINENFGKLVSKAMKCL